MTSSESSPADGTRRIVLGVTVDKSLGFLEPLVRRLRDEGWDVHVVCAPRSAHVMPRCGGAHVHALPMSRAINPWDDAKALYAWVRLLKRLRPDVVVGATPKAGLLAMVSSRATRIPVRVLHVWGARWDGHAGARARLLRAVDRVGVRCATEVVSVSESLAQLLVTSKVCKARPVVLGKGGWPGIDTVVYRPTAEPSPRQGPPVVGFVGRLTADKGIADLISVHAACLALLPQTRLQVVGQLDDAHPLAADELSMLAGPRISWIEWVEDLPQVLATWDVLVFPSRREGMPNVVLEAAACGVPVVGYSVTGVKDAVIDGVTGRLVALGDVEAMARAAVEILTGDASGMRAAARQYVCTYFQRDQVIGSFAAFLDRVTRTGVTADVRHLRRV